MFPQIFGKYVLERELASGGMARVYLATLRGAVGFEKRLVVKQIRPELALDEAFVRRFVEEAKIAVELSHPNIVPVYELGVEQGVYYIAMELCEGLTLTEILTDTGPLDAAEGAHVGVEICRALDYAHRKGGIVHRDVTPRNVLLDEEGAVRLIDFGIAAPVSGGPDEARVEVFGSPGHMPPEQIRGERLTAATDVFAVAALLVEAWTGRPPFRRQSFEASAAALQQPLPSLADEHAELAPIADVIARALALRPAERPQEAEALARKLRDFSRPFDSGDVAKKLGARVRRARSRGQASVPWLPGEGAPLTPAASPRALLSSRPPQPRTPATPPMSLTPVTPHAPMSATPRAPLTGPITRTFAARDDLVEWTRKFSSIPPAPASDAELPSMPRSPPPAVLDNDEPSTRPIGPSQAPGAGKKPIPWLGVAAAAALGVGGWWALGAGPPPASQPLNVVAAPTVASTLLRLPASASPPPIPSTPSPSATVAPPQRSVTKPPASAIVSAAAGAVSAASADAVSAVLRLTADPQATATISGGRISQTQVTPVRALKLPPGAYIVTFRSPTFDQPVVARVELGPGASRSVHADFRAALPTVVVH